MKIRNFNEIYEKMVREKDPMLDTLQRRKQLLGLGFVTLTLLFVLFFKNILYNKWILLIYILTVFFEFFLLALTGIKYKKIYKLSVIQKLVKSYSENFRYNSAYGVSKFEYNASNFPGYYDTFHSEDLIEGNIDNEFNIKMSEIHLEKRETEVDDDGNVSTHYVTVFRGVYGFVNTDIIFPSFYVSSNRILNKYNNSRIEVDSAEFEKYYDLYTNDKIRTMEIFTADLIEEFNKLKENLKQTIEIRVNSGRIFFRFSMNNSFEAPDFKKSLDFNLMYNNFKIIDNPIRLISKIIENGKTIG